jgi:hypothetical protein
VIRRSVSLGLLFVFALVASSPAHADELVPARNQAALVVRILSLDRNLPARAKGEVPIAVLYKPGSTESERFEADFSSALEAAGRKVQVQKRPVRTFKVPYGANFADVLAEKRPVAIYVCPGLEGQVAEISRAAQAAGALTITGSESSARGGLSVALVRRQSKIQIVVNLPSSRKEGADLDAGLLALAEVIR